jgi:protein phosphatase
MPWSEKAKALLNDQYAPVGIAGKVSLENAVDLLEKALKLDYLEMEVDKSASGQNVDIGYLYKKYSEKKDCISKYIEAYRQYCWPVNGIEDFKIAPFHLLATENNVHIDRNHIWHMENIKKYIANNQIFISTNYQVIDLEVQDSIDEGVKWWEELTNTGGEGMVVKPYDFITHSYKGILQPAVKCRGKEYLRIIYGPEYTMDKTIIKLKKRSLGRKRKLAINEFALGIEALKRFVDREPLYRIHECVFGVLALESEPVDPRL